MLEEATTEPIDGEREALRVGRSDVRDSFARWNADGNAIVRVWMGAALLVGIALMLATWVVSTTVDPEAVVPNATFSLPPTVDGAMHLVGHNLLVLAMHALICVAGYMALTSMPIVARGYRGLLRWIHEAAGPAAIAFVTLMTVSSFALQAWSLGAAAPGIALAYGLHAWQLLLVVSLHALPELVAVFLPMGAWLVLVRRGRHADLLAASVLSFTVALPLLVIAAITETWVTPRVLDLVTG